MNLEKYLTRLDLTWHHDNTPSTSHEELRRQQALPARGVALEEHGSHT